MASKIQKILSHMTVKNSLQCSSWYQLSKLLKWISCHSNISSSQGASTIIISNENENRVLKELFRIEKTSETNKRIRAKLGWRGRRRFCVPRPRPKIHILFLSLNLLLSVAKRLWILGVLLNRKLEWKWISPASCYLVMPVGKKFTP